ncbi:D-alanine--D-alanine ligase [Bacillus mangrovi]|uniref:D-alanine--D-alanine ligase n=1 Tax=Metabacillus mangrovi TaxID=1491830 RepID=A0A7X2S7Q0_9BACI|nr:D-alanine--D-alanine ligase [Metabacillus mangrovi]
MVKIKLGLVYGGKSAEHQVSLQTAMAVIRALDMEKFEIHPIYITEKGEWVRGARLDEPATTVAALRLGAAESEAVLPMSLNKELFPSNTPGSAEEQPFDVIFPLLHGPNGEDGTIQGMLEMMNIPYVGNGVLSSAAGMDKVTMKNLFAQAGLAQAGYVWLIRSEWKKDPEAAFAKVESGIGYPCFVKPANLGSSVGISKCKNREELEAAFEEAFSYDRKIIVEEAIIGREIEIGVIGNDNPKCSVAGEIAPKKEFYDYKAKYVDGDTEMMIPASVTEEEYALIEMMAITAFKAIDGAGLVRADFFLTEDGRALINEVNTMPGFTPFSMFPLLWKHTGLEYPELIEALVQLGIERHEEKQQIKHTF